MPPIADGPSQDENRERYDPLMGYFRDRYRGKAMEALCQGIPPGRAKGLPWTPPGLLLLEDFLDASTCKRWRRRFARQPTVPATVQQVDKRNPDGAPTFKLDDQRVTEFVSMGAMKPEIERVLVGAYRDVITPYFDRQLQWMSPPSVLKYVPGGKYNAHADNEYWDRDNRRWVRSLDRDYSLLLYVNDDYEGGSLYFRNFDLRIQPRSGMLIAFPSDHRYLHAAEPLIAGERFVVVCWGAVQGTPKLNPVPRGAITP